MEATVAVAAIRVPLLRGVAASSAFVAEPWTATISAILVRQGTSTTAGDVVANITGRTWSGTLHVDAPNAEELQADVPEASRVTGHVTADAILGGTFDNFQLDTT